ncbi:MAG: hypothetical protein KC503_42325 [Myxococcales bacterium]|nr:hypothetical protein [Myxococcales bacterium]
MISDRQRFDRLEDEIVAMVSDLEFYDYYQLLGVKPNASTSVILYNFNVKAHEYRQLQKHKLCSAELYQNIELLIDRLDEAREVLSDKRLAWQYAQGLDLGNMRHPRVATARDARRPASEPLAIDNRVHDDALERRASQLEEQLQELIHAPDEEVEEISRGIDEEMLEQESQQLAEEVNAYGVALKEEIEEEEEVPIDEEFLDEADADLRVKLMEDGVSMNEDAHLEEDVAPDAAYTEEAVMALAIELAADGVDLHAEDVEPDVTPDFEYTDEAVRSLERELVEDGVFVHDLVEDEDPLAAVDHDFASEAVDRLRRELSGEHGIVMRDRSEVLAEAREKAPKRPKTSDALKALQTVDEQLPSLRALPGESRGAPGGLVAVSTEPDPQRDAFTAQTTTEREASVAPAGAVAAAAAARVRGSKGAADALESARAALGARRAAAGAKRAPNATQGTAPQALAGDAAEGAPAARTVVHVEAPTQLVGRPPPRVWQRRGGARAPLSLAPPADIDIGEPIALEKVREAPVAALTLPDLGEPIEL